MYVLSLRALDDENINTLKDERKLRGRHRNSFYLRVKTLLINSLLCFNPYCDFQLDNDLNSIIFHDLKPGNYIS